MQLGVEIRNDATFPISVILENAESEMEGLNPPRSKFPKQATIVVPGMVVRISDEAIEMENMPCQKLIGKLDFKIKYGLPGKERFELHLKATSEIHLQPFGIITAVATNWDYAI
jgi:hypothetical protein